MKEAEQRWAKEVVLGGCRDARWRYRDARGMAAATTTAATAGDAKLQREEDTGNMTYVPVVGRVTCRERITMTNLSLHYDAPTNLA